MPQLSTDLSQSMGPINGAQGARKKAIKQEGEKISPNQE